MANIQAEFHSDEEDLMRESYKYWVEKLKPRAPKPPEKRTTGKWHFYVETPDHKLKTKLLRVVDNRTYV